MTRPGPTSTPSRDDVLDAATALLRDGGPPALSMRRLADRLGCSYQVVYSRVGGKADVVRAIHDRGFARLAAAAEDARARTTSRGTAPAELIELTAVAYLEHATHDPELFDLMLGAPVEGFVRDEQARDVERAAFRACWVTPVAAWFDEVAPQRARGATTALAWRLWAAVHGVTVVHLAGHESPSDDPSGEVVQVVRSLLRAVSRGAPTVTR